MVKLWGGSGRRVENANAARSAVVEETQIAPGESNIIDFETLLEMYNIYNNVRAAENQQDEQYSYARKEKSLRFLSL